MFVIIIIIIIIINIIFIIKAEVGFLWCENLPPKCRVLQGYGSKPDLQATWNWEEAPVR